MVIELPAGRQRDMDRVDRDRAVAELVGQAQAQL